MMVTQQVTRPEVQVMYVESATGLAGAAEAFDRLEARFPSLLFGKSPEGSSNGRSRSSTSAGPGTRPVGSGTIDWTACSASSTSARVGQAGYRTMTSRLGRFLILTSSASHRAPRRSTPVTTPASPLARLITESYGTALV